jgi:hypothetical protein
MNRNSINDISAYRRRKKQEKTLISIIVFSFAAILVIVIAFNFQAIIGPFEGIAQRFGRQRSVSEGGFPVRLPGSANAIEVYDDGFVLLSPTYIYAYDADGAPKYTRRHGYSTPVTAVGGGGVLLYDQNGRRLSLYNADGLVFENESEDRIVYAAIGSESNIAVVYRSDVHTNYLAIYNSRGEWRFTKRFSGENVMQVAFAAGDRDIIITSIGFESGMLQHTVRRLDTSSDDEAGIWRTMLSSGGSTPASEGVLTFALYARNDRVFVLCESMLFVLDSGSGERVAYYEFRGILTDYAFADNRIALLVNDHTAGNTNLIVLDRNLRVLRVAEVAAGASQAELNGETATVLEPAAIVFFDDERASPERIALWEEFTRFIFIEDKLLVLGYNTVELLVGSDTDESES